MFQPSKEIMQTLAELDSTYRFVRSNGVHCEIICNLTKESYLVHPPLKDNGLAGEPECLEEAVRLARTAEKPMTPSQKATMAAQKPIVEENERLRKELDELKARLSTKQTQGKSQPSHA